MSKPIPQKKSRQIFTDSPVPVKKRKKAGLPTPVKKEYGVEWCAIGIDSGMASISAAAIAKIHGEMVGPETISIRWERGTDYFTRMTAAAKAHDVIHMLLGGKMIGADLSNTYIAMEEPVSFGHLQRNQSQVMKQQIQISGALMGGLLRWGWTHIYEIQANSWRKIVADDLGITTHPAKYKTEDILPLPKDYNPLKDSIGKFRSRQWVEMFHPEWDRKWPDMISSKIGTIPRPEGSKARGLQPDDRYDALAIMEWMRREVEKQLEV